MFRAIRQAAYLAWWQLRSWAGRRTPLQSVIFILDKCNLRCKHCSVYTLEHPRIKTYRQIYEELEDCYKAGSRFIDLEGGELYLWHDGNYGINDVIDAAHHIGFYSVTITTNAQLPFNDSHADQIWVSMDGINKWHDAIRGNGTFSRLEQNIKSYKQSVASHSHAAPVCVNMVINNLNCQSVEPTLEYVKNSPYIDQISINFHTPFVETEDLFLDPEERNKIIDMLIDRKHQGYPIMNSVSGLKAMKMVNGKTLCTDQACWITNFIFSDGSRSPKCMGYTHNVCDRCGFSMGGEMYAVWHMRPDTLWSGMKLRITS